MVKPVLVIKLGSAVITNSKGEVDKAVIETLSKEISELNKRYRLVMVSSVQ
jgi:glutamate 5-kinase